MGRHIDNDSDDVSAQLTVSIATLNSARNTTAKSRNPCCMRVSRRTTWPRRLLRGMSHGRVYRGGSWDEVRHGNTGSDARPRGHQRPRRHGSCCGRLPADGLCAHRARISFARLDQSPGDVRYRLSRADRDPKGRNLRAAGFARLCVRSEWPGIRHRGFSGDLCGSPPGGRADRATGRVYAPCQSRWTDARRALLSKSMDRCATRAFVPSA